jgi:hypothetical protein
VGARDICGIENGGCVGSHLRNGIDTWGNVALADAAIIESDGAKILRQKRAGAVPHVGGIAEAHDEQQRFARTSFIPINFGALIFNEGHGASGDSRRLVRGGYRDAWNEIVAHR